MGRFLDRAGVMSPRPGCSHSFVRSGVGLRPRALGLAWLRSRVRQPRSGIPADRGASFPVGVFGLWWHMGKSIRGCVKHCEILFKGLWEFVSHIAGRSLSVLGGKSMGIWKEKQRAEGDYA